MDEEVRIRANGQFQTDQGRAGPVGIRLFTMSETGADAPQPKTGQLSIKDVYPERSALGPDLSTAIELLVEAVGLVNEALEYERNGERVEADDAMQRMQGVLPELFFCRSLGDGFGLVISSVFHGLRNLNGAPLSEGQMIAVRHVLMAVQNEPLLNFARAREFVKAMAAEQLNTFPSGMDQIQKALEHLGKGDERPKPAT